VDNPQRRHQTLNETPIDFAMWNHAAPLALFLFAILGVAPLSCRRDKDKPAEPTPAAEQKPAVQLDFPPEYRPEEPAIREFIDHALRTCAAGQYDDFRLLWSAREEPLSRDDFVKSFRAVQTIRVRALEKALFAGDDPDAEPALVYVLHVEIRLDPARPVGERGTSRELVLMIVTENEKWRFARAPKAMREWIKEKADASPSGDPKSNPPDPSSP
jgi:hypothetical protein